MLSTTVSQVAVNFKPVIPCPVCGRDHDNDCRINANDETFVLCHTYVDAKVGEIHNGYRCIKESNGHTASFKLMTGELSTTPTYERKIQGKKRRSTEHELHPDLKDLYYREILGKLELLPQHREVLKLRGFSDKRIDEWQFRSIEPNQEVGDYPANLPGVKDGKICVLNAGIVYPVKDALGRIVSLWTRPDVITNGKYKPLSSFNNSVHVNEEIPLSFFPSSKNLGAKKLTEIDLMEGHGFKPNLANDKFDRNTMSASGGNCSASQDTLKLSLDILCEPKATVVMYPDAGDVRNKQCAERWVKTATLLIQWGYQPLIAWWSQITKEDNDIDELDNLNGIEFISVEEFVEIHKHEYQQYIKERQDKEKQEKNNEKLISWKRARKYSPTHTVHVKDFEFPAWIPDKGVTVSVKSGLGTSKTNAMLKMMSKSERGAILLGYRNNLLYQTIFRGGQLEEKVLIYHIEENETKNMMVMDSYGLTASCVDSIKYLDGHFVEKDLYIDECHGVFNHTTTGGTLGNQQAEAIAIFTKAIQECNRIFLLDGHLSDIHVQHIQKIAKDKQVIKIENTQKIAPHTITIVDAIDLEEELKKRDKSAVVMELLESKRPWIVTDSKKNSQVLSKLLDDEGKKGFVLNSETVCEEWAREFLENPDEFIRKRQPDYVILSPTAESGVSVTINNYFTAKFSFFCGVLGTNAQHQQMFRLRDNTIPHFVVCPEKSYVGNRSLPSTYTTKFIEKFITEQTRQSADLGGERACKYLAKALLRQQDEWLELSCELMRLDVIEQENLRTCLIYSLEEAGHIVNLETWLVSDEVTEQLIEARKFIDRKHAEELFVAQELESLKDAEEAKKANPNKEKLRQIEKTILLDKLPEIKDNPIWTTDFIYETYVKRRSFITEQQNYWLLNNFEVSQKRHEIDCFHLLTSEYFYSLRMIDLRHKKIWALNELNLLQFEGKTYCKNSPEVVETIKLLRERRDIQLALNIKIPKETQDGKEKIEVLNKLLDLIGLKSKFIGKKCYGDIKIRYYKCEPLTSKDYDLIAAREAILKCIETRMLAWMESKKGIDEWEKFENEKLQDEWSELSKDPTKVEWLKPESVKDINDMLTACDTSEMLETVTRVTPNFALKAALSLFEQSEINKFVELGLSKIKSGLYNEWYVIENFKLKF